MVMMFVHCDILQQCLWVATKSQINQKCKVDVKHQISQASRAVTTLAPKTQITETSLNGVFQPHSFKL